MIDVLGRDGRIRRLGAASKAPGGDALLARLAEGNRLQADSEHPIARTLHEQQAMFLDDPADRYMRDVARTPAEVDRFREAAGRSVAVVPLVARGRSVGALSVGWQQVARRPARDEWSLIEALAQRIALAVDSALLYQERAYVARTLQQSLLPGTLPNVPGAELAAEYVAAGEGMEVGGDFFDVFAVGEADEWALVIGDVCGKGAEAAALTSMVRFTIRAEAAHHAGPDEVLALVNEAILRQFSDGRFCTALHGRIRVGSHGAHLSIACAGHPPPLVLGPAGTVETVPCSGRLLGVVPGIELETVETDLGPGDALICFTDGVTEGRGASGMFGDGPLAEVLAASAGRDADGIAAAVTAAALEFQGGRTQDDLALLVLRVPGT
jgi:serine phosphatase RsbU (regulator of sigma subunit)